MRYPDYVQAHRIYAYMALTVVAFVLTVVAMVTWEMGFAVASLAVAAVALVPLVSAIRRSGKAIRSDSQ